MRDFEFAVQEAEHVPSDPTMFALNKVEMFIENNPLNQVFIKREKARLPYSVFKPHAE